MEAFENIDPALLPNLLERLIYSAIVVASDSPLEPELDGVLQNLDDNDGEAGADFDVLLDHIFERWGEAAKVDAFDVIPDENDDMADVQFRFALQSVVRYREAEDQPEFFAQEHASLVERAQQFIKDVTKDAAAALADVDEWLAYEENAVIAQYFPEVFEDLAGDGEQG